MIRAAILAGVALAALSGTARAADCGALANLKIENVNLLSAAEVPTAGDIPAYCRVLGYVRPAINFEMRLPLAEWNGKITAIGCGGLCGIIATDGFGYTNINMSTSLRRRYATITSDSGHWGASVADGRWAFMNPVAKADWAFRNVTEVARVSKALVKSYYGSEQKHAYFLGCSTGGRQGAIAASRFPADYDGIVMGAPALDYTGIVTAHAWIAKANTGADGKPILTTAKLPIIVDAVAHACNSPDGLVADPRACSFKPATLQCTGTDQTNCLTKAEVGVLEKWYATPVNSKGVTLYASGIPLGSEQNWPFWWTGRPSPNGLLPALGAGYASDFLRYMAFDPSPGGSFRITDFDFDRDPPRMAEAAKLDNAATWDGSHDHLLADEDVSDFAKRGGKMVIYQGWGDPLVTPQLTVDYFETLAKQAGGVDKAQEFARLFMIPGMDHCGINAAGPGPTDSGFDPLTALEQWVENKTPPASLLLTKKDAAGQTRWTRPACPFPAQARLVGANPNDAASWTCAPG